MKSVFYLVINRKGTTRTVKTRPGLDWDEVSIRCEITLPDQLFQKPQLQANIEIKDKDISPMVIDVEMQNNIKEAIEQHVGVPIKIHVIQEPQ